MRSNELDLTSEEFEAVKQLGLAIGDGMSGVPMHSQLYAIVMYLADTIVADAPDKDEARKVLDDFRDAVDLEMTAMRCSGQRLSDAA